MIFRFTKTQDSDNHYIYDGRVHHLAPAYSNSGLSVRRRRWRLMGVFNAESTRDPTNADNQVCQLSDMTGINGELLTLQVEGGAFKAFILYLTLPFIKYPLSNTLYQIPFAVEFFFINE